MRVVDDVLRHHRAPAEALGVLRMTAVGYLAGLLTTACWIPQILRSWRTRSTEDLSWGYLGVLGAGMLLWAVFGVAEESWPLVATNVVSLAAIVTLLLIKRADRD